MTTPGFNEFDPIGRLVLKQAADAFESPDAIARQWRDLHFTAPPDLPAAIDEYAHFAAILETAGAQVQWLPRGESVGLDAVYVRDASVVTPRGMVLCRMGKSARHAEPAAQAAAFAAWGIPVAGRIEAPGSLEGGDVVWFDAQTVAVGRGYRTNREGIRQLRAIVGDAVEVIEVPLPHWRGEADVFHLMSIISPVDHDLAVVYSPLMPVPFRQWLVARGIALVEVPEVEFESMGANVLAVAPRTCVMVEGNPETRARLVAAGATVHFYRGQEISLKGGGGPTCLTRPVTRSRRSPH